MELNFMSSADSKVCSKCKEQKTLEDFSKSKQNKTHAYCKPCQSEYHFIRRYGLDRDDYLQMFEEQESKCAICNRYDDKLHVDHDHKTGEVRALLCGQCNKAIGLMKDNPRITQAATDYLLYHNNRLA